MTVLTVAIGFVAFVAATGSLTLGLTFLPEVQRVGHGKRTRICIWVGGLCLVLVAIACAMTAASALRWI
jgi:hypothetical protein